MINYYEPKKGKGNYVLPILVVLFLGSLITLGLNIIPDEKFYHCHKNGFLFESMDANQNIFLKTKKSCIDLRTLDKKK